MNKRGQALVEFILILPVILLVLMALIDVGTIFMQKIDLNNDMQTIVQLYKNGNKNELDKYIKNEKLSLKETKENNLVNLSLSKEVRISTPGLTNVLGKKYNIEVKRTVAGDNNEQ